MKWGGSWTIVQIVLQVNCKFSSQIMSNCLPIQSYEVPMDFGLSWAILKWKFTVKHLESYCFYTRLVTQSKANYLNHVWKMGENGPWEFSMHSIMISPPNMNISSSALHSGHPSSRTCIFCIYFSIPSICFKWIELYTSMVCPKGKDEIFKEKHIRL